MKASQTRKEVQIPQEPQTQEEPIQNRQEQKQEPLYYKNSLQHLQEELQRLDLLIYRQIHHFRRENKEYKPGQYRGLFISEEEIDGILKENKEKDHQHETFTKRLYALNTSIAQKTAASLEKGTYLSLVHLSRLYPLTPFEIDSLLVALAPEMDLKYEKLYAYLQNDVTKKRPTIDLCMQLLCSSVEEKTAARPFFSGTAPLFKNHLLTYPDESNEKKSPLIARTLKLDDRLVDFLLETQVMDTRIAPFTRITAPREQNGDMIIPPGIMENIEHLMDTFPGKKKIEPSVFYVQGPGNNGQHQAAEAICKKISFYLLEVDAAAMCAAYHPGEFALLLKPVMREAVLQACGLYFYNCDTLLEDKDKNNHKIQFLEAVKEFNGIVFLEGNKEWQPEFRNLHDFNHHFFQLDFPLPSYENREKLWKFHLRNTRVQEDFSISSVANMFRFPGGHIRSAVRIAGDMALLKQGNPPLSMEEITNACRSVSNQKLAALSRKIQPRYKWTDIVLPSENFKRLQEICNYVKYRHVVYDQWGFDKKLSLGKGLNALFHGPSGTGKTMAAEIIANDLGLDLYKIDLSTVVSKYIGETEKNLSKIFKEAETSNAILFFDEADALFGKRSEVKDAHDRYANIEVAYLLQKMEEYEGIVILATNLLKNIDEAFVRRVHFSLEFPFPDEAHRLKIWKTIFPGEAPREDDIDFAFLARKFKLAGGNIKNIVLTAAFFAAEEQGKIGMKQIIKASKREFQKMGKLSMQSDFGKYYHLTGEK